MAAPVYPDDHDPTRDPAHLHPPLHPSANPQAEPGYFPGDRPDLNISARPPASGALPPDVPRPAPGDSVTQLGLAEPHGLVEPEAVPLPGNPALATVLEPHDEAPVEPYDETLAPAEKISVTLSEDTHKKQG